MASRAVYHFNTCLIVPVIFEKFINAEHACFVQSDSDSTFYALLQFNCYEWNKFTVIKFLKNTFKMFFFYSY